MKTLDLIQGSTLWLAERRKWPTASDMPSILELPGAYRRRSDVLREKITGKREETSEYLAGIFKDGHDAELALRPEAEKLSACELKPAVVLCETVGILASLDAVSFEHGILYEFKSSGSEKILGPVKKGVCPELYKIQIITQMLVTGIRKARLFVLERGTGESFVINVPYCETTANEIAQAAQAFRSDLNSGNTGELEIADDRMTELYRLLNVRKNINEEIAEPLKLLEQVTADIDRIKKAVAAHYKENTITGSGVKISISKASESIDRKALEKSGFNVRPFLKLNSPSVRASLIKEENES